MRPAAPALRTRSREPRSPAPPLLLLSLLGSLLPSLAAGLDWTAAPDHRWAGLAVPSAGRPGFTRLPASSTGLLFTNALDELSGAANRVLYNGAGLAAGDYDGDGWPDLFLCNLSGENALYRNRGGWRFENVTAAAGLDTPIPHTRGAVFADLDGDGHLDLLLTVTGRGVLAYRNDGRGRFQEVTSALGLAGHPGATTLALADVDGNGTLDLYIASYRPDDIRDRGRARITVVQGRPIMAGTTETNRFLFLNNRLEECGLPDQLLLNDGTGRFRPVPWNAGAFLDETGRPLAEPPLDWGLTATFRDVNGDGAPDLYVCNDYWTPDRFWINDGQGRFRAIPTLALRRTSASSMSVDFADLDRDGHLDFFVVDMLSRYPHLRKRQMLAQTPVATPIGTLADRPQIVQNTLFLNRGDTTFAEISHYAALPGSDWSWAPVFLDVDLDGYEDLLIGAGHFRDVQDYDAEAQVRARQHSWDGFPSEAARQQAFTRELMEHYHLYPLLRMPIGAFRNQGDTRFTEVTEAWGLNHLAVHQGLVLADFDQDGDLDLAVNCLNSSAELFRNDSPAARIAVRLRGLPPNTQAIGARLTLHGGAAPRQTTEIIAGGRYQSGADTQVTLAAGASPTNLSLEVHWRSGRHSLLSGVRPNRFYLLDESHSAPSPPPPAPPARPPHFEDASDRLGHRHAETAFDDYDRQPLLPFKLSQAGPGVAWCDLNGDGHEDLVIGTGRGGTPAVFLGNGRGGFRAVRTAAAFSAPDDLAGLLAWRPPNGAPAVLAAVTGYESAGSAQVLALELSSDGALRPPSPAIRGLPSAGALALGDPAGDGRLALFVGGGVVPGRYPLGAPSSLHRFDGRQWVADERNRVVLENLGIVQGARWSDLDGDGLAELVLACEWGPLRVFQMKGGALFEITQELGLASHTGWWRGVAAADLDGDGRLDLIASNWGENSPYRASTAEPLTLLYGELFQPGVLDLIETEYVQGVLHPRRQFMALANALPFLFERFTTHQAFSETTLDALLGERLLLSRRVQVQTLASTVFLNQGGRFQPLPLPREAQFSPAFSVQVADLDGDGHEDVFLSQNFFATQPETPRLDAGTGLWLRGDGTGALHPVPAARAGIRLYGEQRGAALADFDEDGRVDLVVTQNGAPTGLYRNTGAQPGLRVRLAGPPGNPDGLGATLRLQFSNRSGPAREIHAGSGYWSQDSVVQVLATPEPPQALWIRWPGGRITTTPLPASARQVTVGPDGRLLASP